MSTARVRRVEVPSAIDAGDGLTAADYASAFALTTSDAGALTAEQWARATWEGAPGFVRWVLRTGWTLVLGLRLGPRTSPKHILGWPIAASDPTSIALQACSRVITARNIVSVNDGGVTWITIVRFDRALARPMWAMTAPIHHLMIPYLLTRASRPGSTLATRPRERWPSG
jgi:hypothetical protein